MARVVKARTLTVTWALLLGSGLMAQAPPAIRVPQGNGRPILTDGIFSPGEWEDALEVDVRPGFHLLLKKSAGFIFLGIKYTKLDVYQFHDSVDLFVSPDGKSIHQLHVGAQLGERRLNHTPGLEDDPPFDWGYTADWYANEGRWSKLKTDALVKEGRSPEEAQRRSFYKSDGYELQIRQAKFDSNEWLIRLRTYNLTEGTREFVPKGTDTASTRGWLKLILE